MGRKESLIDPQICTFQMSATHTHTHTYTPLFFLKIGTYVDSAAEFYTDGANKKARKEGVRSCSQYIDFFPSLPLFSPYGACVLLLVKV